MISAVGSATGFTMFGRVARLQKSTAKSATLVMAWQSKSKTPTRAGAMREYDRAGHRGYHHTRRASVGCPPNVRPHYRVREVISRIPPSKDTRPQN